MVTEALDESGDCLVVGNFQDLKAHIQEASDVFIERLVLAMTYPFEVILVAWLLIGGYEVINECLTQLLPRVKLVF
jgi:hypothetical protein